jgi:hypothetical protein
LRQSEKGSDVRQKKRNAARKKKHAPQRSGSAGPRRKLALRQSERRSDVPARKHSDASNKRLARRQSGSARPKRKRVEPRRKRALRQSERRSDAPPEKRSDAPKKGRARLLSWSARPKGKRVEPRRKRALRQSERRSDVPPRKRSSAPRKTHARQRTGSARPRRKRVPLRKKASTTVRLTLIGSRRCVAKNGAAISWASRHHQRKTLSRRAPHGRSQKPAPIQLRVRPWRLRLAQRSDPGSLLFIATAEENAAQSRPPRRRSRFRPLRDSQPVHRPKPGSACRFIRSAARRGYPLC